MPLSLLVLLWPLGKARGRPCRRQTVFCAARVPLHFAFLATACLFAAACASAAEEEDRQAMELFERRIRPLLIEKCFQCHGPAAQESELRVDSRAALLGGGQRGPAIVPGRPEESLLIRAVRGSGELKMPPEEKLQRVALESLERWIRLGAPWPQEPGALQGTSAEHDRDRRLAAVRDSHWSLRPIEKPQLPAVRTGDVAHPLDRFVLRRLEDAGLTPSPAADRATLIRRLYFDLIGLPPSFEAVGEFLSDPSPEAYERLVDDLLERPEYGERWARHWLDVARYADTTGYQEGGEPRFAFAWTYRDYVVRSFNQDTPYNEFLIEQLAADQLPLSAEQQWKLAGMGFWTVGPRFNYNRHEIIDDRVDVLSRGLLGLTVACARCHDHKYDPVLTDDYYGLYGILASSREPLYSDLPRIGTSRGDFGRYREFRQRAGRVTRRLEQFHARTHERILHEMRAQVGDYLRYVVQLMPRHRTVNQLSFETERGLIRGPTPYGPGGIVRWQHYLATRPAEDPVFGLWRQLEGLAPEVLAEQIAERIERAEFLNPRLRQVLRDAAPRSMVEVADVYGALLESTYREWTELVAATGETERLADAASEQLRQVLFAADSPLAMNEDEAHDCYTDGEFNEYMGLKRELDSLFVEYQDVAAPRAMLLVDRAVVQEPRVFARGDAMRPENWVPRRFLRALSAVDGGRPFAAGSGRLELARTIADRRNPLTARVLVNRVWQWHFGRGLVETASDFGTRGTPPTHPQLLDYLAAELMDHGWSLKWLHKRIVTSSTYRQSSLDRPLPLDIDPDNRLLWRMNRRRLQFESLRDALLAVAGQLDPQRGGPPDDPAQSRRRTLYLLVNRHDLPGVYSTFDFPSPDLSSARRPQTTVPQQALYLMNNPFTAQLAEELVDELLRSFSAEPEPRAGTQWLYRRILSRAAEDRELDACAEFLAAETAAAGPARVTRDRWWDLIHTLLMSNEFMFVD